ncbi:MAG TPA: hypothetical protein VGM64_20095 [Lacunisphaera sp.]|jgi:hypothetical protein
MDDHTPANENNEPRLNQIDLSQLQSFNFGTQWTEVKPLSPGARRDTDRGERRDRRDDGGNRGPAQRDRRSFHKPAGPATGPAGGSTPPAGDGQRFQPQPQGDRPPAGGRRFDRGPGGPRRDFHGERHEGGGQQFERGPYISPYFVATCYPEDTGFAAMVKAVRASCRTYQLFEITKAVLEKNDRFVVVLQRARPARPEKSGAAVPGAESEVSAKPAAEKPAPLYMSLPDHLPFDTEDAAIQHVLANNLSAFFDTQDVEIEAPKGSFPIINKCGITGELLGPPNYHRYQQILQQHHAAKLSRMPFERFRESIVSVREPEVATQWLEKMKKATRYTWKTPAAKTSTTIPPFETTPPVEVSPKSEAEAAPAADASAPTPVAAVEVTAITFDNIEDARLYLLANARDKVVRAVENVRFHGKLIEKLPPGEIRRALEGHVERQRRFPLDTANALRGRLRRENFTIFKKGSRGVSYVCAVKRRFRVPGQVFSETIAALIEFIEKHPMIHVKDLPKAFLGVDVAATPAAAPAPAPEGTPVSQAPFVSLPPDQAEKLRKMGNDLRWLVMEGYVTEFSDGKLFSPPPMAPQTARKAESGEEEHDPVDFPDAPAPAPKITDSSPPTETEASAPAPASATEPTGETPVAAVPAEEPKPEPQV